MSERALALWTTRLTAPKRTRQAGGATTAVDAQFGARESAHVESCLAQAVVGFFVLCEGKKSPVSKRKNIAGERVAFGWINLDTVVTALSQQFDGFHRQPGQINHGSALIKQTNQRHQMQTGRRTDAMRQWSGDHFDTFGREQRTDLLDAAGIGAITTAHEECGGVEPNHIPGLAGAGCFDLAKHTDPKFLVTFAVFLRFGATIGLSRIHQDYAEVGRQ